jgi:hypothetical protein
LSPIVGDGLRVALHQRLSPIGHVATWHPSAADRAAALVRRPLDRRFLSRVGALEWHRRLGASVAAAAPPADGPRVLISSLRGWPHHNAYEIVIAQALRMRGADVALLTCGGGQPKCEVGWARTAAPRPCDRCAWFTGEVAEAARLPHHRLRDHLPWGGRVSDAPTEAPAPDGFDPYAASAISLAWSMRSTNAAAVPHGVEAARDYAVATGGVYDAAAEILDAVDPEVVLLLNGLFASERAIRDAALARGIRVPTYEGSPRAGSLRFSDGTPAPRYDTAELWERVRDRPLTAAQEAQLDEVIGGRARGVGAHESYFEDPLSDPAALRAHLGLPEGVRVASLFTNITCDSAALERDIGWPSMLDWVEDAVRRAAEVPGLHLVIRVHPAEVRWRTRERVLDVLESRLGTLPPNVHAIGPDQALDSYALLGLTDLVLTYATTVGLEAAVRGLPVAVAGDVHYRGKGFTTDLAEPGDLAAALAEGGAPLSGDEVEVARRYAYAFFFRAMLPFPIVDRRQDGTVTAMPTDAAELVPGRDRYLDFVCDRILHGGPFDPPEGLLAP